ncbi:MAG: hypothetical protein ACPGSM_14660, partial [Thiolinea sp.]
IFIGNSLLKLSDFCGVDHVAIASYAEYLITGDEDLLVLESIGNTSIITPREFMDIHSIV